ELFSESEVTMVNLWGTWCGPCKRELPELAVMAKEFEEQGCRVVGICNDAYAEDKLEKAKGLLQDAGAEYLNLVGSPGQDAILHASAFPSTYFVDREGRLLMLPIVGADVEGYPGAVEEALSMVRQEQDTDN
ncbi:MAG: TlpA family protein disulfide reductase, partial [Lachnospiraceae bacterium]|nr:TlpA family protein disulfide reductase [Lachnospiraceae bacterium]